MDLNSDEFFTEITGHVAHWPLPIHMCFEATCYGSWFTCACVLDCCRERSKSCQQKFEAIVKLKANGRLWSDLEQMRGSVETETAAMAKQKLLMNYKW